ncbi:globin-coupled sensor protein [Bacillus sp. FJAT-42315]|uniref:globin-coupled sensor protein n=1 Tax=Bacillus sp. FJAT-42315 TaxID=2014077 RepID=UPI000C241FC0|nr:globin-coupled sensor protein [Bacillus sp. FJAT-42315]
MLKKMRPRATTSILTQFGTDSTIQGRFQNTLDYNHFNEADFTRIEEIYEKLAPLETEMLELFQTYLSKCREPHSKDIPQQEIVNYIRCFFTNKRDTTYVTSVLSFFYLLRNSHYNLGKLIVMFNQFNFYVITNTLHFLGLKPSNGIAYMQSVQRAINIDQELLTECFSEEMMEQVIQEIGQLMDETTKIMFIKDLVQLLDDQNVQVQTSTVATDEMRASINAVAESASTVSEKTGVLVDRTNYSHQVISDALDEIFNTETTFSEIVDKFSRLQSYVSTIESVVQLINDIADQTNLLALNASIEAARAGEHGKGFAIVAQEVRKLAENTVQSLQKVNENVTNLKSFSQDVSVSIGDTASVIKKAVSEAKDSLPLLTEIVETISEINEDINSTAAVTEEQAATMDEMAQQMQQIAILTDKIGSLGDDTGAAIHGLGKQINAFRLNVIEKNTIVLSTKALLMLSKTDHYIWKWRIYNMFLGLEDINPQDISSHMDCRLGKWYYEPQTKQRFSQFDSYRKLESVHKMVHEQAKEAAISFREHQLQQAEEALVRLEESSEQVVRYIDDILSSLPPR